MSLLDVVMRYYPYVFHPGIMVGGGIVLLIYSEWDRQDTDRGVLGKRLKLFLAIGTLSLVPSLAYMLVTGQGPMETMQGNAWQVDFLVGSGVSLVAATLWLAWRRYDWGTVVPPAMLTLIAVTVPYVAFSPFWNVSGHVTYAVAPTLSLVLVDRRFWPLLAVPVVMVPNRPYVGAHSWVEAIFAFALATVIVVGVMHARLDGELTSRPDGSPRSS